MYHQIESKLGTGCAERSINEGHLPSISQLSRKCSNPIGLSNRAHSGARHFVFCGVLRRGDDDALCSMLQYGLLTRIMMHGRL